MIVVKGKPRGRGYWLVVTAVWIGFLVSVPFMIFAESRDRPSEDREEDKEKGKNCKMALRAVNFIERCSSLSSASEFSRKLRPYIFLVDNYYHCVQFVLSLAERPGNFGCIGTIKNSTKMFPKAQLKDLLKDCKRGSYAVYKGVYTNKLNEQRNIFAIGWVRKPDLVCYFLAMNAVSDEAQSLESNYIMVPRHDPDLPEIKTYLKVKFPNILKIWHARFGAVDQHNRVQQGIFEFWHTFRTSSFEKRSMTTVLGMMATNLYVCYKWDRKRIQKLDPAAESVKAFVEMAGPFFLKHSPRLKERQFCNL